MVGLVAPLLIATAAALALGGSLDGWGRQRIGWWPLVLVALGVQLPLYSPPFSTWPAVVAAGPLLGALTMGLVMVVLVRNVTGPAGPACALAALGIALNLVVILANGGWMPRAEDLTGLLGDGGIRAANQPDLVASNTAPMGPTTHLAWLADTLPQPAWLPMANLVSIGDLLLSAGAAWWAFVVTLGRERLSRTPVVLRSILSRTIIRPVRSRAVVRDLYIGAVTLAAIALWLATVDAPTPDDWDARGVLVLVLAMAVAERLAVPLPRGGAVSVATIPHIVAALLLPPWLAMTSAGVGMLVDQVIGRTGLRKAAFNVSSVLLTVGATATMADRVGLQREALGRPDQWQQVPAFLVVAAVYYAATNLLVSTIVSISSGTPIRRSLFDNAGFAVPAELGVCGIGALIALLWVLSPPWVLLIVFPAVVSQFTLIYISSSKRQSEQLRHQAHHDLLTGLPNRSSLISNLESALAGLNPQPFALLLLDLDRFKEVNDTFGHQSGDLLLREIGPRLRGVLRDSDVLARLGGDEFALLLPATHAAGGVAVAEHLLHALEAPFGVDGHLLQIGGSIGIATYPRDGRSTSDLMRHADVAMYAAKRANLGVVVYAAELDVNSPEQVTLYGELRRAIDMNELRLHFQPKVDVSTGAVAGVEALVRWQHPERGLLHPDQFIPLAERTGLIRPLGQWVLEAALAQCRAWHDQGLEVQMAVNLGAYSLDDRALPRAISGLLERYRVPARLLRVEITETTLMRDPENARQVLEELRATGVRVSIDDFGTGYSSLAYLKRLPADELKIDRSFVQHMALDAGDTAIVRSVIALGHELGLLVTAEGVEDAASLEWLRTFGCDCAQGYFFARPLDAEAATGWLRALQAARLRSGRAAEPVGRVA
jgi:diguanylate cyclase (GGDEF)-like protein